MVVVQIQFIDRMISGCLDRQCVIDVRELDCDDENAYLSNDGAGLGDWIRYRKIQRRGFARELRHRRNKFVNALISRFNMARVGDETDTCGTHKDCNEEQCLNSSVPQSSAPASREATEQARLEASQPRFDKAVRRMNTFTVMNASRLSLTLMPQTRGTKPHPGFATVGCHLLGISSVSSSFVAPDQDQEEDERDDRRPSEGREFRCGRA